MEFAFNKPYTAAIREVEAAEHACRCSVLRHFESGCRELFLRHPSLASFAWKQWTPPANSDDESANDFIVEVDGSIKINGIERRRLASAVWSDLALEVRPSVTAGDNGQLPFEYISELIAAGDDVDFLLDSFRVDDLMYVFGESRWTTVTPSGRTSRFVESEGA